MVHTTGLLVKSAIFAPTLHMWQLMVHCTIGMEKSAISAPTCELWQQMVHTTGFLVKSEISTKCNFCTYFATMTANGPHYRLISGKCSFAPSLQLWQQIVHNTGWFVLSGFFCLQLWQQMVHTTGWLVKRAIFAPSLQLKDYFWKVQCLYLYC